MGTRRLFRWSAPPISKPIRNYLIIALAARLSDDGTATALVLLALDRTGSPWLGGYLLAAVLLPQLLAGAAAGALADRPRTPCRVFALGLAVLAVAQFALAGTVGRVFDAVPLLLAALIGVVAPLVTGGLTSLLPDLVDGGPALLRGRVFDSAIYNTAAIIGPLGASVLAVLASPALAVLAFAALAAVSAALVCLLPVRPHIGAPRRPGLCSMLRAGVVLLWRNRRLGAVTLATAGSYLGVGALPLTLALYAGAQGQAAAGGGFLYAAFALGVLAVSLVLRIHPPRWARPETLVLTGLTACGVVLAAAGRWPLPVPLAMVPLFLAGVLAGPVLGMTFAVCGQESPDALRTHVFVTAACLKIVAAAAGAALAGTTAALGGPLLLLGTGLLQLAAAALGLLLLLLRRPAR